MNSDQLTGTVITEKDCNPDSCTYCLNGKVIAIDAKNQSPECQRSEDQLYFVTGGFGASANVRGGAVYGINLFTGKIGRVERSQVIGEVKPECMPEWAKGKADPYKGKEKRQKLNSGNQPMG